MLTQELAKAAPPELRSPAGISPNLARLAEEADLALEILPAGSWTGHALGPADSAATAKALLHGLAEQPGGDAAVERPLAAYRDDTLDFGVLSVSVAAGFLSWRSCPASTSRWAGSAWPGRASPPPAQQVKMATALLPRFFRSAFGASKREET